MDADNGGLMAQNGAYGLKMEPWRSVDQWSQIRITLMRSRIRILIKLKSRIRVYNKVKSRIRIHIKEKKEIRIRIKVMGK
jgi:hypothetical protein